MSILKVARMGHPVLRRKARDLDRRDIKSASVQRLIDDLIETMIEYRGVGLAAPQVHEGLRLFVALKDPQANGEPVVLVNPEISVLGNDVVEDWEGCLSIPDVRGMVPRVREVSVRALNREGERIEFRVEDFAARVIQHEYDHIEGILFLDRMRSMESLAFVRGISVSASPM